MRSVFGFLGFLVCHSNLLAGGAEKEAALKVEAKKVVDELVQTLTSSDLLRDKLKGLSAENQAAESKPTAGDDGWVVAWEYKNGVKSVPNPNPAGQFTFVPRVDSEDGILIRVYVAFEDGMAFQISNGAFGVSDNPTVRVGYRLLTKTEHPALENFVKEQCNIAKRKLEPFCVGLIPRERP